MGQGGPGGGRGGLRHRHRRRLLPQPEPPQVSPAPGWPRPRGDTPTGGATPVVGGDANHEATPPLQTRPRRAAPPAGHAPFTAIHPSQAAPFAGHAPFPATHFPGRAPFIDCTNHRPRPQPTTPHLQIAPLEATPRLRGCWVLTLLTDRFLSVMAQRPRPLGKATPPAAGHAPPGVGVSFGAVVWAPGGGGGAEVRGPGGEP